jgi:imidazolonepropionase-like amidohydrolase
VNKAAESDVWMGMKPNLRLSFHLVALSFVAILVIGCSGSQPSTTATSSPAPTLSAPTLSATATLALVHGELIDGTGAAPVADATVVIATDKIVAVGPAASTPVPSGVQTVDLHGAAILPGFINAHVHEAFDKANLKAWAEGGVTTVRDESATPETVQGLKALKADIATDPHLARLVSMGSMLKSPGGYGQREVTSADNARQVVLDEIASGVDGIKIANEDGYAGQTGLPKLTPEELKAIVDTAHAHGLPVSGHITSGGYMMTLLEAGVDDIAHGPIDYLPDGAVEWMVAHDTYLTPTFSVYKSYGTSLWALEQSIGQLSSAGVHIALGNDYGGGPGEFELGIPMIEIEEMAASGMTPMQIIEASTRNGAHELRLDSQVGTVATGKVADLLVVAGDPLADLEALRNVSLVVHNGTIIRDNLSR